MTRKRRIYAADLFCGAGGTSTGLFESCAELGLEVELLAINHESCVDSIDRPLRTLTASNGGDTALVEPFLVPFHGERPGQAPRTHSVNDPTPTIATSPFGLIEPFLVTYYGNGGPRRVDAPAPTLTAKDRLGLVQPAQLDIRFRMLQPHELAAAMSFPDGYRFIGNRADIVRQIGNAVPVRTAAALCGAALGRRSA